MKRLTVNVFAFLALLVLLLIPISTASSAASSRSLEDRVIQLEINQQKHEDADEVIEHQLNEHIASITREQGEQNQRIIEIESRENRVLGVGEFLGICIPICVTIFLYVDNRRYKEQKDRFTEEKEHREQTNAALEEIRTQITLYNSNFANHIKTKGAHRAEHPLVEESEA
jgi:hypothetical protein